MDSIDKINQLEDQLSEMTSKYNDEVDKAKMWRGYYTQYHCKYNEMKDYYFEMRQVRIDTLVALEKIAELNDYNDFQCRLDTVKILNPLIDKVKELEAVRDAYLEQEERDRAGN